MTITDPRPTHVALADHVDRIIAGASVGTIVFAAADTFIYAVNPAFRVFLAEEYRDVPLRGRYLKDVLPLGEEPELRGMIATASESGQDVHRAEMRLLRISAPDTAWDVDLTPVRADGAAAIVVVLSVVRAVASRRGASSSAREMQLLEKIEEMQLLNDVLIASVQQKHHFVTAMSHRLRTPLTTIVGYGEMLAAGAVPDEEDRRMVYGDVVAAGQQMLGLIDDMIELARLDAGDLRLRREYVAIADILDDARDRLESLAASRRQRLVFDAPAGDVVVFTDARWTTEVVLKLGMNALRFSPTGGVVTFRVRDDDETHIALDVADTGVGIAPDDQAHLFDVFGTAGDTSAHTHGTGLELALAKRLVELQGGTITFTSTRGVGTTFTVTLPRTGVETADEPG